MGRLIRVLNSAQTNVTLLGTTQKGGAFFAFLGPIVGGLSQWKAVAGVGWDGRLIWAGVCLSIVGTALNQGASWAIARGREKLDRQHSNRLTAALRAIRDERRRGNGLRPVQEQLLRCIAETARNLGPTPDAEVVACLLAERGAALEVVAYSSFRSGSFPSARIPLDEPEGAARAYRESKISCIADVRVGPASARFEGKRYRSIVAFPLLHGTVRLGVIAVDSTVAGHFRPEDDEIVAHLLPFIEVFVETLDTFEEGAHVAEQR